MNTGIKPILFSTSMVESILNGTKTQTRRMFKGHRIVKGDILWVRETWANLGTTELPNYKYKASYVSEEPKVEKWSPSLFMPKDACRIFLEVLDVKIERLHSISEADSINEGVEDYFRDTEIGASCVFRNYTATKKEFINDFWGHVKDNARDSFKSLWISLNGKESWNQNPLVSVYIFKCISKPSCFNSNPTQKGSNPKKNS